MARHRLCLRRSPPVFVSSRLCHFCLFSASYGVFYSARVSNRTGRGWLAWQALFRGVLARGWSVEGGAKFTSTADCISVARDMLAVHVYHVINRLSRTKINRKAGREAIGPAYFFRTQPPRRLVEILPSMGPTAPGLGVPGTCFRRVRCSPSQRVCRCLLRRR
jgi:hypothetical protein